MKVISLLLFLSFPSYSAEQTPKKSDKPVPQPMKEAPKRVKEYKGCELREPQAFYFVESDKALLKFALANAHLKKKGWKRV